MRESRNEISREEWRELADERWDETRARRVLAAWFRSGQSGYAFAREHGLNAQRLSWWRRRLQEWEEPEAADDERHVVEAKLVGAPLTTSAVVVHLRDGTAIEVDVASTEPGWVASLVRELGRSAT